MLQRHQLHALPQPVCKVYHELHMHIGIGSACGSKQDREHHQSDTCAYPKHVTNVTCIHSTCVYIYYSGSEAMNALAVLSPSKTEQKDIKNYSREKFRDAVFAYMEIKFRDYTHDFIQLPQN